MIARPGFEPDGTGSGFLVNCWAYHGDSKPHEGQWIWMELPPLGEQRAGRVVAVSGQEVEWTGRQWRVDGHECHVHSSLHCGAWPQACRFKVPSDQILVEPDDEGASTPSSDPLVLVPPDRIIGRAWAHFYPVWDRHLAREFGTKQPAIATRSRSSMISSNGSSTVRMAFGYVSIATTVPMISSESDAIRLSCIRCSSELGLLGTVRESTAGAESDLGSMARALYPIRVRLFTSLIESASYVGVGERSTTAKTWSSSGARIPSLF